MHPQLGVSQTWLGSPRSVLFWGLPRRIMGNKCFFPPLFSPAREAGGFGRLRGKTNTLPQISSSHSLELVLAKTPLSGDSTKVQANHAFEERGPRGVGWRGRAERSGRKGDAECP